MITGMEKLIEIRQNIIKQYKIYEKMIVPLAKFLFVFIGIVTINNGIGCWSVLDSVIVEIALGLIGIVLPIQGMLLLFMGVISAHLIAFELMVGLISVMFFAVLYILYIRLYPKESLLIVFMLVAIPLNLMSLVVLLAGLFFGISSIVAVAVGMVISALVLPVMHTIQAGSIVEVEQVVEVVKVLLVQNVLKNEMLIGTIVVNAVVITAVYIIRKQAIDYAPYIAVGIGGGVSLIGFLIASLLGYVEINVFLTVVMTIISIIITLICQAMARVVDYSRADTLQFEDEDNYYYVKVVPKIYVKSTNRKVKAVYGIEKSLEND